MAKITQSLTTTTGRAFTGEESELLAALIYKRFGYELPAAAAAWRRLLGNSCTDQQFSDLANLGRRAVQIVTASTRGTP